VAIAQQLTGVPECPLATALFRMILHGNWLKAPNSKQDFFLVIDELLHKIIELWFVERGEPPAIGASVA